MSKNDPLFLPAGAEAFKRDVPDAEIRFFDTAEREANQKTIPGAELSGPNF